MVCVAYVWWLIDLPDKNPLSSFSRSAAQEKFLLLDRHFLCLFFRLQLSEKTVFFHPSFGFPSLSPPREQALFWRMARFFLLFLCSRAFSSFCAFQAPAESDTVQITIEPVKKCLRCRIGKTTEHWRKGKAESAPEPRLK